MRIIRGRKALVTGAASGIGRAIALELAREGADLFLLDIDAENLERVAIQVRQHGVAAITEVCDLVDPAAITRAVESLVARWGELNIVINNAGVSYYGATETMRADQWRRIIAVNLMAPIQLVHELLPVLLAADEAHVLNVCSMFGLAPWRKAAVYQTSKYGLVGFTAALRTEFHREQFGVTALCPGFVRTSMLEPAAGDGNASRAVPAWISTTPEALARKAIEAIRRNRGLVLVTPAAHLYWRFARLAPGLVDWLLREGWRRRNRIEVLRKGT
jgi:3-oxoacyl-[acyl-carrier protein] reductase